MKNYLININNSPTPKELEVLSDSSFSFNGTSMNYEYKFVSPNILVIRIENKNFVLKIEKDAEADSGLDNSDFLIDFESEQFKVNCKNELDILVEKFSKNRADKGFKKDLISPMPGSIVKINVKEGEKVKKGQVVLVLEAMKMENELKATNDAIVSKILVEEKKPVNKGQALMKLEPVQ